MVPDIGDLWPGKSNRLAGACVAAGRRMARPRLGWHFIASNSMSADVGGESLESCKTKGVEVQALEWTSSCVCLTDRSKAVGRGVAAGGRGGSREGVVQLVLFALTDTFSSDEHPGRPVFSNLVYDVFSSV